MDARLKPSKYAASRRGTAEVISQRRAAAPAMCDTVVVTPTKMPRHARVVSFSTRTAAWNCSTDDVRVSCWSEPDRRPSMAKVGRNSGAGERGVHRGHSSIGCRSRSKPKEEAGLGRQAPSQPSNWGRATRSRSTATSTSRSLRTRNLVERAVPPREQRRPKRIVRRQSVPALNSAAAGARGGRKCDSALELTR